MALLVVNYISITIEPVFGVKYVAARVTSPIKIGYIAAWRFRLSVVIV